MTTGETREREAAGRTLAGAARRGAGHSVADASAGFLRRAEDAGLVDVAYGRADSPLGPLVVASTARGLVRVAYLLPGTSDADVAAELSVRVSPRVLEAPGRLDAVRRELDEYFAGERRGFDLPIDWQLARGFGRAVLEATAAVPYGQTASYTEVAERAGNPRAPRAAGNALNRNPIPIVVPCHRVLQSGGRIGGYAGGPDAKRFLLTLEGAL